MKVIVYEIEGGKVEITVPAVGERLCNSLTLKDGTRIVSDKPLQADRFMRRWPVEGSIPQWAETEDQWVLRVAEKIRPSNAKRMKIIEAQKLDRSTRDQWIFCEEKGVKLG